MRDLRPPPVLIMPCRTPSMTATNDDPISTRTATASLEIPTAATRHRRRSVSQRIRQEIADNGEAVYSTVNQFLTDLSTRLEPIQELGTYGKQRLDARLERAYMTLQNVREACSHIPEDFEESFRHRAKILVEIVETSYPGYRDRLPTRDSLDAKTAECIQLLEGFLGDIEGRAYALKTASALAFDESWKRAEDGLKSAREFVDDSLWKAKESLMQSIAYAKQQARERGLLSYDDLPAPWQMNPHILKGYRFCESNVDCVVSVFKFTNEFVNIWSHAIGLMIILALAFYYFPNSLNYLLSTNLDIFFVTLFFFAAAKCLVCSCIWHTFNSIADQTLMERFACVDYTGISLLIAASNMTVQHIAFYCDPTSRWIWVSATATLGAIGVAVPWHPFFNRNEIAWLRVGFYVSLGAVGVAPLFQLSLSKGIPWALWFYAPLLKSFIVYLVGAIIYAMKIPEQFLPGWFDYFGGSHNIWHFAVLGGIFFHYYAITQMFSDAFERAANDCPDIYY